MNTADLIDLPPWTDDEIAAYVHMPEELRLAESVAPKNKFVIGCRERWESGFHIKSHDLFRLKNIAAVAYLK